MGTRGLTIGGNRRKFSQNRIFRDCLGNWLGAKHGRLNLFNGVALGPREGALRPIFGGQSYFQLFLTGGGLTPGFSLRSGLRYFRGKGLPLDRGWTLDTVWGNHQGAWNIIFRRRFPFWPFGSPMGAPRGGARVGIFPPPGF